MSDGEPAVPADVVARVRALCLDLPEAYEEEAWVGTRWRVKGKTFAHVIAIADGWPGAYARAAGTDGPATVLTALRQGEERGISKYDEALGNEDMHADSLLVIRNELLPACAVHVTRLDALIEMIGR